MAPIPENCGENVTVNVDSELLPPIPGHDCDGDALPGSQGNPVVHQGVIDARIACVMAGVVFDVNVTNSITVEPGVDPLAVTFTPAVPVERLVDGDIQVGVGTITIPDGVISYAVTVLEGGSDVTDLATWVTIDGPDFAAAVPLAQGQSVSAGADAGNTLSGPIDITVPANAAANATWVTP